MNWVIILCLVAAGACAALFVVILYRIFLELFPRAQKASPALAPNESPLAPQSEEERAATLLSRHGFVITMMERYQATGASGDVMDFINHELRGREAGWRVRILPDGSGEFYDIAPANGVIDISPAKARLASGK